MSGPKTQSSPYSSSSARVIFVGPSLPLEQAKLMLSDAEYRPPIRRGDLDKIPSGAVVGIIDGLFAQTLAISPGEIREAVDRGVGVYGAASMGALRAAEVSTVVGVGRIFEMYRAGEIERDDEVAVVVDPETHKALTVPLVNVRFGVERLVRTGTMSRADGMAIVEACQCLHFTERSYPKILSSSKLAWNRDVEDVIRLLRTFDLKRDDAQLLLETIASAPAPAPPAPNGQRTRYVDRAPSRHKRAQVREAGEAPLSVWESGDSVDLAELIRFLKITGKFEPYARNAIARLAVSGSSLAKAGVKPDTKAAQALLDATRVQWGWESPEEAHVTMRDLGLGLDDVADSLEAEVMIKRLVVSLGKAMPDDFAKALRAELWLNELGLKREVLRLGALRFFAGEGAEGRALTDAEIADARRCVARVRGVMRWSGVEATLGAIGIERAELDAVVGEIAFARRVAAPIVAALDRGPSRCNPTRRASAWRALGLGLESSPKADRSNRFSLGLAEATAASDRIAGQMGVVRIGLVGELDTLGAYIAQAFGERAGWSSSFSSGKAETREGARIGSIMEEVEIHAQDAYEPARRIRTSFAESSATLAMVNPRELDLPFDSRYSETLEIDWSECVDLLGGRTTYVPTASLVGDRQPSDIYYSPRLGGKIFSSSGLGSGFTLAEAMVHAAAEDIERHALRLAELELDNPGGVGARRFWFVDEETLPETPARIAERYRRAGMCVRILDMTSEIAVPTFFVRVFDDPFKTTASMSSDGFACHPDPEVALTMALLESAQTRGGFIAGGREDYSLQARSLGRHERPRTAVPRSELFWFSGDRPIRSFGETVGFVTRDILSELEWIVDRVEDAGFEQFLVADYTMSRIHPAHAVRVLIPGMETTNPLYTGPRGRATLIRDLLPRGAPEAERGSPTPWEPPRSRFTAGRAKRASRWGSRRRRHRSPQAGAVPRSPSTENRPQGQASSDTCWTRGARGASGRTGRSRTTPFPLCSG